MPGFIFSGAHACRPQGDAPKHKPFTRSLGRTHCWGMEMTARRSAAQWWNDERPLPPMIDVLIPTAGRVAELAVTLAGLAAQDGPSFRVVLSDQSDNDSSSEPTVAAMLRLLRAQGRDVVRYRNVPPRGMAEQRQFLFERSIAPYVLYLDDDVWLEPGALTIAYKAIRDLRCGLVGFAPQGLSYLGDDRPHQRTTFETWEDGVRAERLRPGSDELKRVPLHNAANLAHQARTTEVPARGWVPYKIAWVGGCALFDRAALSASGAFGFWKDVPALHAGEDVTAQWRVMERFGGAGLLPSRAVHLETPTTIPERPVDVFNIVFASDS
jgi:hypothetical protein